MKTPQPHAQEDVAAEESSTPDATEADRPPAGGAADSAPVPPVRDERPAREIVQDKGATGDLTATEIIDRALNLPEADDSIQDMTMTLINKRGEQRVRKVLIKAKNYEGDLTKSISFFLTPADVKGTGFLTWENEERDDDQWLYLPAIKKIRRISSNERDRSFLGTDFTYEDMQDRETDEGDHTLLREEEYEGKPVWVIETIPNEKADSQYSKLIAWIGKENFLTWRVQFFDEDRDILKNYYVDEWSKMNGIWTAVRVRMENVQKKHKTLLVLDGVKHNQGVHDDTFTTRALERGI